MRFCFLTLPAPPQALQGLWMILPVPGTLEQGAVLVKAKAARPPLDADGPGAPAVRADLRCGP